MAVMGDGEGYDWLDDEHMSADETLDRFRNLEPVEVVVAFHPTSEAARGWTQHLPPFGELPAKLEVKFSSETTKELVDG